MIGDCCLKLLQARLDRLHVLCPALWIQTTRCHNCSVVCGAGFVLLAGCRGRVSQRPLWIELIRRQLDRFLSQRQGFLWLLGIKLIPGKECAAYSTRLLHVHIALVDQYAVVDLLVRLNFLEVSVRIRLLARPKAAVHFSSAQQDASMNDGRDNLLPGAAQTVG